MSHDDLRLFFGLGEHTAIDWVSIRWPLGQTQKVTGVAANTFLTVEETVAGD